MSINGDIQRSLELLIGIIGLCGALIVWGLCRKCGGTARYNPVPPVNSYEDIVYRQLISIFPEFEILVHVPICRFVQTNTESSRWTKLNQELLLTGVVDFLICRRHWEPVAAVDLRQLGFENKDEENKISIMKKAGIPLLKVTARELEMPEDIKNRVLNFAKMF